MKFHKLWYKVIKTSKYTNIWMGKCIVMIEIVYISASVSSISMRPPLALSSYISSVISDSPLSESVSSSLSDRSMYLSVLGS